MKKILIILGILVCVNLILIGICKSFVSDNNIDIEQSNLITQTL